MENLSYKINENNIIKTENVALNLYQTISENPPKLLGYDLTKPVPDKLIVNTGISIVSLWIFLAFMIKIISKYRKNNNLKS